MEKTTKEKFKFAMGLMRLAQAVHQATIKGKEESLSFSVVSYREMSHSFAFSDGITVFVAVNAKAEISEVTVEDTLAENPQAINIPVKTRNIHI